MPLSINKIAVAIDMSDESLVAFDQAMAIARLCGAELVMIHAGEVYSSADFDKEGPAAAALEHYGEILKERQTRARAELDQLRERHVGQGVTISQILVTGFADEVIPEAAKEIEADLLVLGTHGRTGIKRFFLGSVAERVVRLAECDVMIARPVATGPYRNVLVPSDFSALSERALDAAVAVSDPEAAITLMHCSDTLESSDLPAHLADSIEAVIAARAEKLSSSRADADQTIRFIHERGNPADRIRALADQFDLICMGSHGRRGVRRLLLGSVAELIVRHAPCSVYVAHEPSTDDDE